MITPSYNQGAYIEQTLQSVLDQEYPNLEYFVMDGGSTDQTVEVLRRYAPRLSGWVSEKDRGQSHAINKGLERSTGDILCWLNSDDYFAPRALWAVAEEMGRHPAGILAGAHVRVFGDGRPPERFPARCEGRRDLLSYWRPYRIHQPSVFWRRSVHEKIGPLREDLHLIMDYEYWLRMTRHFQFHVVPEVLSYGHVHSAAKTGGGFEAYTAERRSLALAQWRDESWSARAALHLDRLRFQLRSTLLAGLGAVQGADRQ